MCQFFSSIASAFLKQLIKSVSFNSQSRLESRRSVLDFNILGVGTGKIKNRVGFYTLMHILRKRIENLSENRVSKKWVFLKEYLLEPRSCPRWQFKGATELTIWIIV